MNKTPAEIRDNRDKLLIVLELVKQNIGKKYLNQVIGFLDDLADEADNMVEKNGKRYRVVKQRIRKKWFDGRDFGTYYETVNKLVPVED